KRRRWQLTYRCLRQSPFWVDTKNPRARRTTRSARRSRLRSGRSADRFTLGPHAVYYSQRRVRSVGRNITNRCDGRGDGAAVEQSTWRGVKITYQELPCDAQKETTR